MTSEKCPTCGELDTFQFAPEWDDERYVYYRCNCCGHLKSHKINTMTEFQNRELDDFIQYLTRYRGE